MQTAEVGDRVGACWWKRGEVEDGEKQEEMSKASNLRSTSATKSHTTHPILTRRHRHFSTVTLLITVTVTVTVTVTCGFYSVIVTIRFVIGSNE